jgi:TPR repeat protein
MYDNGQGVPKSYAEAVKWYRESAEHGDAAAQNNLGVEYQYGTGVPKDYVQAYMWFNLAASAGEDKAAANRDAIEKRMTTEQTAEAQRRSSEWKPKGS